MDNKKFKIITLILAIITVALTTYIVYDKLTEKDLSNLNNNTVNQNNNKQEEHNNIENNKQENIGQDETENCNKEYKYIYNDNYIYKIKITNPSGANIYDNYLKSGQNIIGKIEYGKEIGVVADKADEQEIDNDYNNFSEIENNYYFAINVCGKPQYVKYSDVEIIDNSITSKSFVKTTKFYVDKDTYLYSGPGLSFEKNDENEKIPKGTILNVDKYINIYSAEWLYVDYNGKSGWILRASFHSENYPYNNYKYGNATSLDEEKGELYLETEENLYKYAFSNDEVISKIPKGTKVSYDYTIGEPGTTYYHINYNNHSGWISIVS